MKMEWFPPTFEGTEITGTVNEAAAEATGLKVGTPVMAGGGDQAAGAVGVGAVQEGIGMLSLGTSGVLFASAKTPVIEPSGRLHSFCHAVPDLYHMMGVILSAAGSLRWFHDTFAEEMDYDTLVNAVSSVPAGAEGLIFLPYLTGERTPHADPLARGAFVGLTVRHTFAHMTRAVLEGVAMALKDNFVLMQSAGMVKLDEIRVTGGGAKSPVWRQIIADVFGAAITSVNTTEGAAYGAALLAGVGAGEWQSVADACASTIKSVETVSPNMENAAQYDKVYEVYRKLYPALKDSFVELSEL
jgi:xylulokinase